MKIKIELDTHKLFTPEYHDLVDAYLRGDISAATAAKRMGLTREEWERHLATVFLAAVIAQGGK